MALIQNLRWFSMAILRNKTQGNYTVITNNILRDNNLSLKARGLLCTMLSLPDNWEFSEQGLNAIILKDGITSIRSGLKELQEVGYLVRYQETEKNGKFGHWVWEVFEKPKSENPKSVKPKSGNPPQLDTKESSTNKSNTKEINNNKRFIIPSLEEVEAYCKERNNNVDPQRFIDYYESKGWLVGKTKMKDWKAAVRNWERNSFNQKPSSEPKPYKHEIEKFEWGV